jgi:hypothetical protein
LKCNVGISSVFILFVGWHQSKAKSKNADEDHRRIAEDSKQQRGDTRNTTQSKNALRPHIAKIKKKSID